MHSSRARDLLESPIGLELLTLIARRGVGLLSAEDIAGFLAQVRHVYSRYLGHYDERVASLKAAAPTLAEFAEWLASETAVWWEPLNRDAQVWASPGEGPPTPTQMMVDLQRMHVETSKPKYAFWTSTLGPAVKSPWLDYPENLRRQEPHSVWRMTASPDAHVVEIHSPAEWWAFCYGISE